MRQSDRFPNDMFLLLLVCECDNSQQCAWKKSCSFFSLKTSSGNAVLFFIFLFFSFIPVSRSASLFLFPQARLVRTESVPCDINNPLRYADLNISQTLPKTNKINKVSSHLTLWGWEVFWFKTIFSSQICFNALVMKSLDLNCFY